MLKHQKIVSRYLSSHTIYKGLLLVHAMGTGKTCAAIGVAEQIRNEMDNIKPNLLLFTIVLYVMT